MNPFCYHISLNPLEC